MLNRLDAVLFAFAGLSTLWLAYLLVRESAQPGWPLLLLVVFWVLLTYLLLPRLHRILTRIYVPGYFIGRAHTSDGLLGDPINLALLGSEAQVHLVMTHGGWTRADDLSVATGLQIVRSTLRRRSYAGAPVSPLLLFDRQQDFAYQQEVDGSPSKRHHVRFWRAPDGWMLPGGYAVDWLAAGTYDRNVGLSLFTLQITHKIEANTDVERDHVVATVKRRSEVAVEVIRDFSTGYHSRNGGGDVIQTDGDLPIIDVRHVSAATSSAIERTDSRDKRPAQIVVGAAVACLRGFVFLLAGVAFLLPPEMPTQAPSQADDPAGLTITGVLLLLVLALGDIGLALAVMYRRNWARIALMLSSVVAVVPGFIDNARHLDVITLGTLPTVGMSILILLALSSHRARDYTARHRRRGRHEPGGGGGVAGVTADPALLRITEMLNQFYSVPISVVELRAFTTPAGDLLLAREETGESDAAQADQPSARPNTPESERWVRVEQQAERYGLGDALRSLRALIEDAGLYPRPYTRSVMITPPNQRPRYLAVVGFHGSGGRVLWGADAFREFYPHIDLRQAEQLLGLPDQDREVDESALVAFGQGLVEVMAAASPQSVVTEAVAAEAEHVGGDAWVARPPSAGTTNPRG